MKARTLQTILSAQEDVFRLREELQEARDSMRIRDVRALERELQQAEGRLNGLTASMKEKAA